MNRKQWMHGIAWSALTAGMVGAAVAAGPSESAAQPSAEFGKLDVNHDGYLSRGEARKLRGFEKPFKEADGNRDGRLDPDEFVKAQSIHERIHAGQYVDDGVITAKVKAALLKDWTGSATAVSVETNSGTVLLSGFVDSAEQARRAAEIASGVEGVVSVKNGLVVKS
jgi:hyperosmotically inducible protein